MKKVVLVFIHGMGDHQSNYDKKLKDKLKQKLGAEWNNIHCEQILYSERMQNNEEELFRRLSSNGLDWNVFRKFMLYNISDAAALCNCIAEPNCPYINTQQKIKDALGNAYRALGDNHKNVIIVAHSLGGHVISNYIWDCQTNNGIWENTALKESDDQDRFLRLMHLDYLFTTGCNIPIFVAKKEGATCAGCTLLYFAST